MGRLGRQAQLLAPRCQALQPVARRRFFAHIFSTRRPHTNGVIHHHSQKMFDQFAGMRRLTTRFQIIGAADGRHRLNQMIEYLLHTLIGK